jgi:hypothetical protein
MAEAPTDTLLRWDAQGGVWRSRVLTEIEAVVDLCACTGEPVDQLRSGDPALLRFLRERPRSDPE